MKLLPVFAFFTTIYGNFAAPTDDVMQEKLMSIDEMLLPPKVIKFEGEGVRDRFEGNKRGNVKFDVGTNFYEFKIHENGNYHYEYHQSDLQRREESGVFDHDQISNDRVLSVNGSYEYIRPDGKRQIVEYTAGKDGFKPKVTVE